MIIEIILIKIIVSNSFLYSYFFNLILRDIYLYYYYNNNNNKILLELIELIFNIYIYKYSNIILIINFYNLIRNLIKNLIIYIYNKKNNKIKDYYIPSSGELKGDILILNYFILNKNEIIGIIENNSQLLRNILFKNKNIFIDNINYTIYNKKWLKNKILYINKNKDIDELNKYKIIIIDNYYNDFIKNYIKLKIKEKNNTIIIISKNINDLIEFTNNIITI